MRFGGAPFRVRKGVLIQRSWSRSIGKKTVLWSVRQRSYPDSIFAKDSPVANAGSRAANLPFGFFRLVDASTNLQNLADAAINFFQQRGQR